MTLQEPWEKYPEIWKSKPNFFTYLRGHLRLLWSRYPAKLKWKSAQLITPPAHYIGRAKKLGKCEYCSEWFAASHLEVDHVVQAGECNSWETSSEFLYNLLNCNNNWKLTCKPCHKIKSHAEKNNISFEEAATLKEIIRIFTEETKEDIIMFIQMWDWEDQFAVNNEVNRKAAMKIIYEEVLC